MKLRRVILLIVQGLGLLLLAGIGAILVCSTDQSAEWPSQAELEQRARARLAVILLLAREQPVVEIRLSASEVETIRRAQAEAEVQRPFWKQRPLWERPGDWNKALSSASSADGEKPATTTTRGGWP